jgi:hypothetical protein
MIERLYLHEPVASRDDKGKVGDIIRKKREAVY